MSIDDRYSELSKIKRKRSEIGSIGLLPDTEPIKDDTSVAKKPKQKHGGKRGKPLIYSIDPRAKKNQTPRDLQGSSLDHSGVTWISDEEVSGNV